MSTNENTSFLTKFLLNGCWFTLYAGIIMSIYKMVGIISISWLVIWLPLAIAAGVTLFLALIGLLVLNVASK